MSTTPEPTTDTSEYALGEVHPNTQGYATFRTKPTTQLSDRKVDTGGGYERWRSNELRPHTARQGKEDVYVPVHRLSAVAWCYPEDMEIGDVLAHMEGKDVHHTTGVEWLNFHESPNLQHPSVTGVRDDGEVKPGLEVMDHGRHAEITQTEMRAFAEDAKRRAQGDVAEGNNESGGSEGCSGCGSGEAKATTERLDGEFCLECVRERAREGETIEVL